MFNDPKKLVKSFFVLWAIGAVLSLTVWISIIVIAVHLAMKYW